MEENSKFKDVIHIHNNSIKKNMELISHKEVYKSPLILLQFKNKSHHIMDLEMKLIH